MEQELSETKKSPQDENQEQEKKTEGKMEQCAIPPWNRSGALCKPPTEQERSDWTTHRGTKTEEKENKCRWNIKLNDTKKTNKPVNKGNWKLKLREIRRLKPTGHERLEPTGHERLKPTGRGTLEHRGPKTKTRYRYRNYIQKEWTKTSDKNTAD